MNLSSFILCVLGVFGVSKNPCHWIFPLLGTEAHKPASRGGIWTHEFSWSQQSSRSMQVLSSSFMSTVRRCRTPASCLEILHRPIRWTIRRANPEPHRTQIEQYCTPFRALPARIAAAAARRAATAPSSRAREPASSSREISG